MNGLNDKILFKDVNNSDNFIVFKKEKNGTYLNEQNKNFYVLSRIDKYDLMYFAHNKLNNPNRLSWPLI